MLGYITKRFIGLLPIILVMTFIIFLITNLLPGDPTVAILGYEASPEARASLRRDLGLDEPIYIQYIKWLKNTAKGDLGKSIRSREYVIDILKRRIPVTIELTLFSMMIAVILGIPAGVFAAIKRNTWIDFLTMSSSLAGVALPFFWLGVLLIMLFSLKLGWLPSSGYISISENIILNLKHLILPAITIGLPMTSFVVRQTRSSMLEVLSDDYVTTAFAKGLKKTIVYIKHVLRNALIPVVTVIGLQLGVLLGGAIITETVFSLPGIGRMVVNGIYSRDFPVVQGGILFFVTALVIINLLVDILYFYLDPRINY